jgi:hypothetical protein
MKKAEARKIIENMGLPAPQERAARRTIARATASDEIDIVKRDSGQLVVTRSMKVVTEDEKALLRQIIRGGASVGGFGSNRNYYADGREPLFGKKPQESFAYR